jgi:hypothetical protein
MCCDASSPEEKSEEPAKQNEDRTGHSGGCCGLGGWGGEAGNRKYQLIGFLVYLSIVIAIIWFLPHRPIP